MDHFFNYTLDEFTRLVKAELGKNAYYSHATFSAIYRKAYAVLDQPNPEIPMCVEDKIRLV